MSFSVQSHSANVANEKKNRKENKLARTSQVSLWKLIVEILYETSEDKWLRMPGITVLWKT